MIPAGAFRRPFPFPAEQVSFYVDPGHVDGLTGARVVGELVMHLMDRAHASVVARPFEGDPNVAVAQVRWLLAALPRPPF